MLRITVNSEAARAAVAQAGQIGGRPILAAAAGAVADGVRRHFLARNAEPNRKGWPKRNFWTREGANHTAVGLVTDAAAVVQVSSAAIAHKLTGGTIRPGPGRRALAIPLTAEASAAGSPRLGVLDGLFRPRGTRILATRGAGGRLVPQYALAAKVTQAADPRTLPPARDLQQAAVRAADAAVERALRRGAANRTATA